MAHAELHRRGFEAYLPLLTVRLPNRHYRTSPLFQGYLFVRMRLDQPWNPVRYAPGVFSLLSIDGIPSICPDAVLDALRAGEASRATPIPENAYWAPGMPCSLAAGALSGHHGVVTQVGPQNATVALMFLGYIRTVTLPLNCLTTREE